MRWLWLILWLLPAPVHAQVRVTGGEHAGFTRLVLQGPGLTGWQVSRLPDGYALRLRGASRFDLSRAFDKIGRQRVAGLAALDDGTGLQLSIRCACHAIPFDYRPGIVVIDLRDGPPPPASSSELDAQGQRLSPLSARIETIPRPRARPAPLSLPDWTLAARQNRTAPPVLPDERAQALRGALLEQFARAASQGLIDVAEVPPAGPAKPPPAQAEILLGDLPGLRIAPALDPATALAADGTACIPDDRLAIETWGDPDRPALAQLAEGMATLTGEFDRADPERIAQAVRLRLWLGFGAEAAQLADAFPPQDDTPIWQSLARLIDDAAGDAPAFDGMAGCDGPAALWATLAKPDLPPDTDKTAVRRAFSALPAHLRDHLGPPLADRFLRAGDTATAQTIRDAMARAAPGGTDLIDAAIALLQGDADRAEAAATAAMGNSTDPTTALIALVTARAAQADPAPVSATDVTTLEAALHQTPDAPDLLAATTLARALAGDFDGAFVLLPQAMAVEPDLWRILAAKGPDSALLAHAIRPADTAAQADVVTANALADRLTGLGFGTAALRWIGPDGDPIRAARAELARNDPRAALWRLGNADGDEAADLRADLSARIGNDGGLTPPTPPPDAPEVWQNAAQSLADPDLPQGPLSRSRAVLAAATDTRARLADLLAATPQPDPTLLTGSKDSGS